MIRENEIRDNIENIICVDSMLFVKEKYQIICDDKIHAMKSNEEEINHEINEINEEYGKAIKQLIKESEENIINKDNYLSLKIINNCDLELTEKINELLEQKDDEIETIKHTSGTNYINNHNIYLNFNNDNDLSEIVDIVKEEYYHSDDEKIKCEYINKIKSNIKHFNQQHQKTILEGADLYITSLIENKIHTYLSKIDNILDKIYN